MLSRRRSSIDNLNESSQLDTLEDESNEDSAPLRKKAKARALDESDDETWIHTELVEEWHDQVILGIFNNNGAKNALEFDQTAAEEWLSIFGYNGTKMSMSDLHRVRHSVNNVLTCDSSKMRYCSCPPGC